MTMPDHYNHTNDQHAVSTVTEISPDARKWAMIAHLSALVGLLGNGIGFVIGPLLVWAIKKDPHPFVDEQGKEAINFQLTVIISGVAAIILGFTVIGLVVAIPLILVTAILAVIFPIIGGIRANEGHHYRYPFSWRLIK